MVSLIVCNLALDISCIRGVIDLSSFANCTKNAAKVTAIQGPLQVSGKRVLFCFAFAKFIRRPRFVHLICLTAYRPSINYQTLITLIYMATLTTGN